MARHDPAHPGHRRVFELLRQRDNAYEAIDLGHDLDGAAPRHIDLDAVKEVALQSFKRDDLVVRSAKPGRDHKLL